MFDIWCFFPSYKLPLMKSWVPTDFPGETVGMSCLCYFCVYSTKCIIYMYIRLSNYLSISIYLSINLCVYIYICIFKISLKNTNAICWDVWTWFQFHPISNDIDRSESWGLILVYFWSPQIAVLQGLPLLITWKGVTWLCRPNSSHRISGEIQGSPTSKVFHKIDWFQPLWKNMKVSWNYYSQYMESHKNVCSKPPTRDLL